ncbi:hypothetical protein BV22DRAFT_138322 [Leucogyrophana mollusca]|uniref:Uncharacterized protein n=1 Tax=Leucogyrophana mollusca TaxID=85980 RepID=A0ACB8BX85_9AGAM|nr:hypothetical protein BV22DRAFT_138322 [Leucogyrophana mollusca]
MTIPLPSTKSLIHRARIAHLITPLKRTRPKTPFYVLAAHRIPTLWSLYRGLLRHALSENTKFRVRMLFRMNRRTTNAQAAQEQLAMGHKWLDIFLKAKEGDSKLNAVLTRYDRMIGAKRDKEEWKLRIRDAFEWQDKLLHRPIFKGSFIRPTLYNTLLPRLSPQPKAISAMIFKRRTARARRYDIKERLQSWTDDLRHESMFEAALVGGRDRVYSGALNEWEQPIRQRQRAIHDTFMRDTARERSPYPTNLLRAGKQARRDKILNKTREREREARGEVLTSTIKRRRTGPPAHVLETMTAQQRILDRAVRAPGEVGYVAIAKMRRGMKLKHPEKWKRELGSDVQRTELGQVESQIRVENERRRDRSDEAERMCVRRS